MDILEINDLIVEMSKLGLVMMTDSEESFEISVDLGDEKKLYFTYFPMWDCLVIIVEESIDELIPRDVEYIN